MSDAAKDNTATTAAPATAQAGDANARGRGRRGGRGGRGAAAGAGAGVPAEGAAAAPAKPAAAPASHAPAAAAATGAPAAGADGEKRRRIRRRGPRKTAEGAAAPAAGAAAATPAAAASEGTGPKPKKELTQEQIAKRAERAKRKREKQREVRKKLAEERKTKAADLQAQLAEEATKPPVFGSIKDLTPDMERVNLVVKVVGTPQVVIDKDIMPNPRLVEKLQATGKTVVPRKRKIAEVLVGDQTGSVLFSALNEQIEQFAQGATFVLRNAMVKVIDGSMRVAIGRYGQIQPVTAETAPGKSANFNVATEPNVSNKKFRIVIEE